GRRRRIRRGGPGPPGRAAADRGRGADRCRGGPRPGRGDDAGTGRADRGPPTARTATDAVHERVVPQWTEERGPADLPRGPGPARRAGGPRPGPRDPRPGDRDPARGGPVPDPLDHGPAGPTSLDTTRIYRAAGPVALARRDGGDRPGQRGRADHHRYA